MAYVYRHRRSDNSDIFYIGVGTYKGYKRAKSKSYRNNFWHKIVNKTDYTVEIIADNLSIDEAFELEVFLISEYGRRDLNLGSLVNLTDGGEGNVNMTKEVREKISKKNKEYYEKNGYCEIKRQNQIKNMKGNSYRLGYKATEEERIKGSIARSKIILNLETGIYYLGIKEASDSINKSKSWLIRRLLNYTNNNTNLIYI